MRPGARTWNSQEYQSQENTDREIDWRHSSQSPGLEFFRKLTAFAPPLGKLKPPLLLEDKGASAYRSNDARQTGPMPRKTALRDISFQWVMVGIIGYSSTHNNPPPSASDVWPRGSTSTKFDLGRDCKLHTQERLDSPSYPLSDSSHTRREQHVRTTSREGKRTGRSVNPTMPRRVGSCLTRPVLFHLDQGVDVQI